MAQPSSRVSRTFSQLTNDIEHVNENERSNLNRNFLFFEEKKTLIKIIFYFSFLKGCR